MSKVYQEKIVPEQKIKELVRRACDLCGVESRDCYFHDPKWDDSDTEVSITARRAKYYGNDGNSVSYEIDLCPKCFWDRLVPWLKSEGADRKEDTFSW